MKIVKLGKEDHKSLNNILSDIAKKSNIDQVKSVNIVLKPDIGIVKYALTNQEYIQMLQNDPLGGVQNPATNFVQQGAQQALTNTPTGVNEVLNPGSMAMNAVQQAQQVQQTGQQQTGQQSTGTETATWKPQMRGQGADLFTQTEGGAGQLIPVVFEGAIDPQAQNVQVWNTQTNSKQWVPMASVFESGTQRPYPFQGTQAETSPGNMENPPANVAQAKQDLQDFYYRLSAERELKEADALDLASKGLGVASLGSKFVAPQAYPFIKAANIILKLYNFYRNNKNLFSDIFGNESSSETQQIEQKAASITKEAFEIQGIIDFFDKLISDPRIEQIIANTDAELAMDLNIVKKIINVGSEAIDKIKEILSGNNSDQNTINVPKGDYKVSNDIVQLNSETILVRKGSDLYNALESKIEKIAEQNNIDGINGIKIEVTPEQFKVAYLKNEKVSYKLTSKFAAGDQFPMPFGGGGGLFGGGATGGESALAGAPASDSGGGIMGTVMNVAKPIYGITGQFPNLTGGASVLGSIMLAKAQGKEWNLFDNGLVPFLAGRYGGPLTMAAVMGTQAAGMEGLGKWALILGGFIIDNAMKTSIAEDENKKKALEYAKNNMDAKLYKENPQFARMISTYLSQMRKTNPDYTFQQAKEDLTEAGVNASVFGVIEKIASIKRIMEADSVHISMNEDYAVFRFKNAVGEIDPNTGQPIVANSAQVDPNTGQPAQSAEQPAQPAEQPAQPAGQPAQPAGQPAQETPETQEQQPLVSKDIEEEFKKKLDQLNNLVEQNSAAAKEVAGNPTGGEEEAKASTEGLSAQITALADEIQNDTRFKPLIDQMNGQIPKEQTAPAEGQVPQQEQQPVQQEQQPVEA
jgi:hypothetical protein